MSNNYKDKRIVFLGTPDFAVESLKKLIDENYNVVAVITAPDKPSGRGQNIRMSDVKMYANDQKIPVLQPTNLKSKKFLDELKSFKADIQVVVAFRMLPEVVWNMPEYGTVNVHGSLLPRYRGAAPINWAIINGEKVTGVTTFLLKHKIDTGDILLQKKVEILPEDNFGSMYEKLKWAGADLLHDTLQKYFSEDLNFISQIDIESTHAPKIFKEDCLINFNSKTEAVYNFIRGLSPIPTAFTHLNNKVFKVYESEITIENHEFEPGHLLTDSKSYMKYACLDGFIVLKKVQIEGKKMMDVGDFLRGYKIQ